jgi:1,2-diacylglycerol 3-alpha-glucosyltransferase
MPPKLSHGSIDYTEQHGPLVWVVINCTRYHYARLSAYAEHSNVECVIIEITNKDDFAPLEYDPAGVSTCRRITVFPNQPLSTLPSGSLRQRLRAMLNLLEPSAVCVNGWALPGSIDCMRWCAETSTPAILMSESNREDARRSKWKESIKGRLLALCASALVGGDSHEQYLRSLGFPPNLIFRGYDAIDNHHFYRGAEAARACPDVARRKCCLPANYFLMCSRLEEKKNIEGVLGAFAQYTQAHGKNSWKLVILGSGSLETKIKDRIRALGIAGEVILAGPKSYRELPTYYGLARAFVHGSTTEQWGLVVNEAMASGLPVLVSDKCGCARQLVVDGMNGFKYSPYDSSQLTKLMLHMTSAVDELPKMGETSLAIISRYGLERFATGLDNAVMAAHGGCRFPYAALRTRLLLSAVRLAI